MRRSASVSFVHSGDLIGLTSPIEDRASVGIQLLVRGVGPVVFTQLLQEGGVVVFGVGVVSAVAECVGMEIGRQVVILVHGVEQLGSGCALLGKSYVAQRGSCEHQRILPRAATRIKINRRYHEGAA
jgi:hypothetical protein